MLIMIALRCIERRQFPGNMIGSILTNWIMIIWQWNKEVEIDNKKNMNRYKLFEEGNVCFTTARRSEHSHAHNMYSLSAQKWTSVNCVTESRHKLFIGLQCALITIAPNRYPQPIKSVMYANNSELTNKFLRWTHVWYSWLIGHN